MSQSRSTDIYNLMSDFIPIYKCLYGVPMHYFTVLDVFLEHRAILTRHNILECSDIFPSSNFRPTQKRSQSRSGDVNAGPGLNPVFLRELRGLIKCKFARFAMCELNILFANFDVLIM